MKHAFNQEAHPLLPEHGGDIAWAARTFNIQKEKWIDLSTGISPWSYPTPNIPQEYFHRLPYDHSMLLKHAERYYGCSGKNMCALNGTQSAIEKLPYLVPTGTVYLPKTGYNEHARHWTAANHNTVYYDNPNDLLQSVHAEKTYIVIIRPNSANGAMTSNETLRQLENSLSKLEHSLLVIDEAYIDIQLDQSFVTQSCSHNTVVLRSLGKFFGLAGIRLGFAIGKHYVNQLRAALGLWQVNNIALYIGSQALQDNSWITKQRSRITHQGEQLFQLLTKRFPNCELTNSLQFVSVVGPKNALDSAYISLARQGVLTRYLNYSDNLAILRVSLPGERWKELCMKLDTLAT